MFLFPPAYSYLLRRSTRHQAGLKLTARVSWFSCGSGGDSTPLKKTGKLEKQTHRDPKPTTQIQGLLAPNLLSLELPLDHTAHWDPSFHWKRGENFPVITQTANSIFNGGQKLHEVSKAYFTKPFPDWRAPQTLPPWFCRNHVAPASLSSCHQPRLGAFPQERSAK